MKYRHNPQNYSLAKKIAIKLTPEFAYDASLYLEEVFTMFHDRIRFMKTYSKQKRTGRYQLESRITYHAHALEKGLSHEDLRFNFGKTALKSLSETMRRYAERGYSKETAYDNGLSVLKEYIDVHEAAGESYNNLESFFDKDQIEEIKKSKSTIGGTVVVKRADKIGNKSKSYKDLFMGRYSVREFSADPIDIDRLDAAISLATKTPTVCNRQAVRVRKVTDPKLVKKTLFLQAGLHGYDTPPAVLAVTVDNGGYVRLFERNQGYVDGGAFSAALLTALEFEGLAACSLNAMFRYRIENKLRRLLNIKNSENIIMFIAVGNFKDSVKVPKSFRYAPEDITIPAA